MPDRSQGVASLIRKNLHPITGASSDYDPLMQQRQSQYFYARLIDQFDALLHFDQTHAVEPLERTPEWNMEETGEPAETFPSGL